MLNKNCEMPFRPFDSEMPTMEKGQHRDKCTIGNSAPNYRQLIRKLRCQWAQSSIAVRERVEQKRLALPPLKTEHGASKHLPSWNHNPDVMEADVIHQQALSDASVGQIAENVARSDPQRGTGIREHRNLGNGGSGGTGSCSRSERPAQYKDAHRRLFCGTRW